MESIEKIKSLIKEKELVSENEKVLVGISGGADSVCLLLILKDILAPENITAVHINHGIRGEEAARDEEFVIKLCEKYNIYLEIRHLDVPAYARENKISEEEAGRILRYKTFDKIALENEIPKIAVAHNMNDTAETFLMNLVRGSGITGLTGIKVRKDVIIRPLIKTGRAEIEEIVRYYGESYITDSTNSSLVYARNRIRNRIIPELVKVNEQAVKHINEAAEKLYRIEKFLSGETDKEYRKYVSEENGIFIHQGITDIDDVVMEEVFHRVLTKVAGKARNIGSNHILCLKELFYRQTGREICMPYKVKAYREYEGVRLIREETADNLSKEKPALPELETAVLEIDEISDILADENNIELIFKDGSIKNLAQNSCIKWFDYDKISKNVLLRYRKDGDYLIISDEGMKKKLKKYFTDSKIPSEKRDNIPVIACDNEILWVVGYRTGEGARITRTTRNLLKMEIKWK